MTPNVTRRGSASPLPNDRDLLWAPRVPDAIPRHEQTCAGRVMRVIQEAAVRLCPTDRYSFVAEAERMGLLRRTQASNS